MQIKELKEIIKDLPEDMEVRVETNKRSQSWLLESVYTDSHPYSDEFSGTVLLVSPY